MLAIEILAISIVCTIYIVSNDVTGIGIVDDVALIPLVVAIWDSANKIFA